MIGSFEKVMMLTVAIIIGITYWIWKSKTNMSTLKKLVITITIAIGLIAAAFFGLFFWVASSEASQAIGIEEVNKPLNKFEYMEITDVELEEYPVLKEAVSIGGHNLDVKNRTEWERTQKFLDDKRSEQSDLFVINEADLEEELNKSTVTDKMKGIFASEGYTIPENSYINQDGDTWYVMKRYYLFSVTNPEIEKELNRINFTVGKDAGDVVPTKLRTEFSSNGFSLSEDARISRNDQGWVIHMGTGYTILKEEGKMNVYIGDEKIYEILRGDGKLKVVYLGPQGSPVFKIREKYYSFTFKMV